MLVDGLVWRPLAAVSYLAAGVDAAPKGVKSPQNSYGYDYNGNLISDSGKGMTAEYNHLNLPREITIQSSNGIDPGGSIKWDYDATGRKLKKISPDGHTLYHDGIEKAGGGIFVYHAEGRVAFYPGNPSATPPVEDEWYYEFSMRDHLGNTRITLADLNGDGYIQANPGDWIFNDPHGSPVGYTEILQENHYYPFGMNMDGAWAEQIGERNRYQYNGKELDEDLELNWNDYGARWYDAAVGRWNSVDPLAADFASWSTYSYTFDNPVRFVDPDGRSAEDIIIGNKDLDKRWEAFRNLEKLTNDVLAMDSNGKVTIAEKGGANTDKTLTEGTKLVSDLINDNNTTTIELGTGRGNGTFAVNESTNTEIRIEPLENFEYGANVYVTGADPNTVNADGSRGLEGGAFITLGHELNHARDLVTSSFDRTVMSPVIDFDKGEVSNEFRRREYNTRIFENKLRNENNFNKPRALPIPLSTFNSIGF